MANGKIVVPLGRIVKRITIELDEKGQAALKGQNLHRGLSPMSGGEVAIVLSQMLTNVISAALMGSAQNKAQQEAGVEEPSDATQRSASNEESCN